MADKELEEMIINKGSLNVSVTPYSKKTRIVSYDAERDEFKIEIKAPPEKNKGNEELIRFLEKITRKRVKIISGKTSRKKIIKLI